MIVVAIVVALVVVWAYNYRASKVKPKTHGEKLADIKMRSHEQRAKITSQYRDRLAARMATRNRDV